MTITVNYLQQARDFLYETKSKMVVKFLENNFYFSDDKTKRDIYQITLTRGKRKFVFRFGQSIKASGKFICWENPSYTSQVKVLGADCSLNMDYAEPSEYDVLVCLTKYEVGTFENFCTDFGYDVDSRSAEKIYQAVVNEYQSLCTLYNDKELEKLQQIN